MKSLIKKYRGLHASELKDDIIIKAIKLVSNSKQLNDSVKRLDIQRFLLNYVTIDNLLKDYLEED